MDPALLVPHPEAIPVPYGWFQALLLLTFVLHLLVMNTMLGIRCAGWQPRHFHHPGHWPAADHRIFFSPPTCPSCSGPTPGRDTFPTRGGPS